MTNEEEALFQEWHGRCQCGGAPLPDDWRMPPNLRGRTCREVYAQEHPPAPCSSQPEQPAPCSGEGARDKNTTGSTGVNAMLHPATGGARGERTDPLAEALAHADNLAGALRSLLLAVEANTSPGGPHADKDFGPERLLAREALRAHREGGATAAPPLGPEPASPRAQAPSPPPPRP